MRILILGGTAWLGRELTRSALAAGHEVTCLARRSDIEPGATSVVADRDEPDAYSAVSTEHWDAVIDVARQPGHVRGAAWALAEVADRYTFISTASVYADQSVHGQDETAPLLDPLDDDAFTDPASYGAAKVACEIAVTAAFGPDRTLILRPGLIGGPDDPSGRTTYWPWRFAHPSNSDQVVLTPDAPDQPTSVIDVRDVAEFTIAATARGLTGVFNTTGDPMPLGTHLAAARDVAGHVGLILAAASDWLTAHDVHGWGGPRSLPIWVDDPESAGVHTHLGDRAVAAGLMLRPLTETLEDGLLARVMQAGPFPSGLSDEDERELINEATTTGG